MISGRGDPVCIPKQRPLTTDSQFKGAQRLYADMLSHGYTTVCEFHYTHGAVQRDNAEIPVLMAESLLRASESTGNEDDVASRAVSAGRLW